MRKEQKKYNAIVRHYEQCLDKYGDSHLGVDWPSKSDAEKRYGVMLDVTLLLKKKKSTYSLLDFGCGTAHLKNFIDQHQLAQFQYAGMDMSDKFIQVCRQKYPHTSFDAFDALEEPDRLSAFDLIVMNGVFTEKRELSFDQMWTYFTSLIQIVYSKANCGVAFNVMSKQVDWEREDLFHVPHDLLVSFLCKHVTRNYLIRNDYGLYEYTVYLYK